MLTAQDVCFAIVQPPASDDVSLELMVSSPTATNFPAAAAALSGSASGAAFMNAVLGSGIVGLGGLAGGVQTGSGGPGAVAKTLSTALEKGSEETRVMAMKRLISLMLNGEQFPQLLMTVIRFVMPQQRNKTLKKLFLMYLEICPKLNPDGKLKQEMILVCDAIRKDLQHPNEYMRGAALRFACKLRESELLEPMMPAIRACLEHRHPYVRRNGVLAVLAVYRHQEHLIPDAPELLTSFLAKESDSAARRNAFISLYQIDPARAIDYFNSVFDQVGGFDESMQLAIIDLIRKDARTNTPEKARYVKCILALMTTGSAAVRYDCANTLLSLTTSPTAVKAVANAYIELIVKESDNNVKLIVLDLFKELHYEYERILEDHVMDLLRTLSSPDIDVRRKCLDIAMDLVSSRNVDDVVAFLKKEIAKTHNSDFEKTSEYRQLLINSIHSCAVKYSEVASAVVQVLMQFLADTNASSAIDVVTFVREVVEKFPAYREPILARLMESFTDIKSSKAYRGALWIVGEYCLDETSIESVFKALEEALGEVPIVQAEQRVLDEQRAAAEQDVANSVQADTAKASLSVPAARRILPDGTYATETALPASSSNSNIAKDASNKSRPPIRNFLITSDWYFAAMFSVTLTKLTLRYAKLSSDQVKVNQRRAQTMLVLISILRLGRSSFVPNPIDNDTSDRIMLALRILAHPSSAVERIFLQECRAVYSALVVKDDHRKKSILGEEKSATSKIVNHFDSRLSCRWLLASQPPNLDDDNVEESSGDREVAKAVGRDGSEDDERESSLNRVVQLTGYSDAIYAEAYVYVHQYDVLLDVLLVNNTSSTLQNVLLEISTLGDLKLVERPTAHTLAPNGFHSLKASIKVSSTDNGVIFGTLVYDGSSPSAESQVIVLQDLHVDILDYIRPGTVSDTQFRTMWLEFEWENKVIVNTPLTDLKQYLAHLLRSTNMRALTDSSQSGDCDFLAANCYARSIFGEDVLANVCLELSPHPTSGVTTISGHVRIRSKTQGIAYSIGEKINVSQKSPFVNA